MDVSFAVIVVQAPDPTFVADLIVSLEALDVLPLFRVIHLSFLFVLFGVMYFLSHYIIIYYFSYENFWIFRNFFQKYFQI